MRLYIFFFLMLPALCCPIGCAAVQRARVRAAPLDQQTKAVSAQYAQLCGAVAKLEPTPDELRVPLTNLETMFEAQATAATVGDFIDAISCEPERVQEYKTVSAFLLELGANAASTAVPAEERAAQEQIIGQAHGAAQSLLVMENGCIQANARAAKEAVQEQQQRAAGQEMFKAGMMLMTPPSQRYGVINY